MAQPYKKPTSAKSTIPCSFFKRGACHNPRCPYAHIKGSVPPPVSAMSDVMATLLRLLFQKQQETIYNPSTNSLFLSRLKLCEDLKDVTRSIDFNAHQFCDSLCRVIKETIVPPPTVIAVDGNEMKSLLHFLKAIEKHELHHNLYAFSAKENALDNFEFTSILKTFPNLQEIVLEGNPIATKVEYRKTIKRHLPKLLGLDTKALDAPPLSLPWPSFPPAGQRIGSETSAPILNFIERLFHMPVDSLTECYAPTAVFTFSLSSPSSSFSNEISPSVRQSKDVVKDVITVRIRQGERDRNITRGMKVNSVATGRASVMSALLEVLYPPSFRCQYTLHESPQLELLSTGMKVEVAVATVHGQVQWTHATSSSLNLTRTFVRTIVVAVSPTASHGVWITNDLFQLSEHRENILMDAKAANRLERLGRHYNVPAAIAVVAGEQCTCDSELIACLADLRNVTTETMDQCATLTEMNLQAAVQVGRVVGKYGVSPAEALSRLQAVNMNFANV